MKKFVLLILILPQLVYAASNFHEMELHIVDPEHVISIEVVGDMSIGSRFYKESEYIQITTDTETFQTCHGEPYRFRKMIVDDLKNFIKKTKKKNLQLGLGISSMEGCLHFFMVKI